MRQVYRHRYIAKLRRISFWLMVAAAALAAGCGGGTGGSASNESGGVAVALNGMVHGGQNPVIGTQVIAYQAGSSGYGKGEQPIACTTTDSNGRFSYGAASPPCSGTTLPASLTCPSAGSPQLYFVAQGGNPGAGVNTALLMMASVGNCNNLSSSSFVTINEVTTVASVWTLSQFMNCAGGSVNGTGGGCGVNSREVGATATNSVGLANAMALTANLANPATGQARMTNPEKTPPTSEINTLGDILQDCVNSSGAASTACKNLFSCVVPGAKPGAGNLAPCTVPSGSVVPADTLTAALDIARNPVNNVVTLFNLTSKVPAFTPPLPVAPSDWTVAINYASGGLNEPTGVTIDAAGNAWIANFAGPGVIKLDPLGDFVNGVSGYTGGGISSPHSEATDPSGNVWVAENLTPQGRVVELNQLGLFVSPTSGCPGPTNCGYTGGGLNGSLDIVIDGSGNAWVANSDGGNLAEISPAGVFLSPTSGCPGTSSCGFTGGGLSNPTAVAIDGAGNVWVGDAGSGAVIELSPGGVFLSPTSGCPGTSNCGYRFGSATLPGSIAIDLTGNAWVTNLAGSNVVKVSSTGIFLSPTSGCPGTTNCGYTGGGLNHPAAVAIDSTGNAWVANCAGGCGGTGTGSVTELSPSGGFLSPTAGCPGASNCGYTGGGINQAFSIAVDAGGNVWVVNGGGNSITQFAGAAGPVLNPLSACLKLNTGRAVCLP